MTIAQIDLFGQERPPQGLDYQDQVAWIMDRWPETRDSDQLLYVRYLLEFHSLGDLLPPMLCEVLAELLDKAPSLETLARRRREIHERGILLPSPEVLKRRKDRDGAGPPLRRKA